MTLAFFAVILNIMKNKLNFKNLIKLPALEDEWTYIVNNSYLADFPRWQWDFRIRSKERAFPRARVESFAKGIKNFAEQKERGETTRHFIYPEAEMAADETKRRVLVYLRLQNRKSPLALILPGGAYQHVSIMNEGFPVADRLFERGYSTAVLLYRVEENASGLRPVEDLARTMEFFHTYSKEFQIDARRITLWGGSASGHLCGYYCAAANRKNGYILPRSVVLSYPVVTFDEKYTHLMTRKNFCGHEPSEEEIKSFSVENFITKNFPPTYIWHCEGDKAVSVENSRLLERALKSAGVEHTLHIFPDGAHGLGAAAGLPEAPWLDEAIDFCDKYNKER